MTAKLFLRVTAAAESLAGATFLAAPSFAFVILLGRQPGDAFGPLAGRIVGVALLLLGLACWRAGSRSGRRAASRLVAALLLYDVLAALLLVYARVVLELDGIGLWPAVLAHGALALWGLGALRHKS